MILLICGSSLLTGLGAFCVWCRHGERPRSRIHGNQWKQNRTTRIVEIAHVSFFVLWILNDLREVFYNDDFHVAILLVPPQLGEAWPSNLLAEAASPVPPRSGGRPCALRAGAGALHHRRQTARFPAASWEQLDSSPKTTKNNPNYSGSKKDGSIRSILVKLLSIDNEPWWFSSPNTSSTTRSWFGHPIQTMMLGCMLSKLAYVSHVRSCGPIFPLVLSQLYSNKQYNIYIYTCIDTM